MVANTASAQTAYRYAIIAGPAQSIDCFSPSSLNETGEVVYADNANGFIATSTGTLAEVGDMIDGELLGAIAPGSWTSINDNGLETFRARYGAGDFDAIFTPTSVVAKAWDNLTGITLGFVGPPAINDAGTVAFIARHAGGFGIFTQTDAVLREGQQLGSQTVRFLKAVAINHAGVIAAHVNFESNFDAIVLATPEATNHYARMTTGSSVALQQSVDVPGDAFSMRVDHRFATNSGQLNVRLGGVFLGSVGATAVVGDELERVTFDVSGALLGQSGLTLELELDGPIGSTLEVDNVFFPNLVNGTFESGSLAGWQAVSSGAGVPEPSATLASLVCGVVLVLLRCGASMRRPGFAGRC